MGYFEDQRGLPAGDYSTEFLEIDAKAGPWLSKCQCTSVISGDRFPRWELDRGQGVIRFLDDRRVGALAAFQILGTYTPEDGLWLWSWSNPSLAPFAAATARLRDEHPDIPEFSEDVRTCTEAKAWALAAAAAHELKAQGCCRLPGEVQTFVALFDIKESDAEDPRAALASADGDRAHEILSSYAGPMALHLGAMLLDAVASDGEPMDPIIRAGQSFCDCLDELSLCAVGQGTPAAAEASELSAILRSGVLCLSLPPTNPALVEGIKEMLSLLHDVAVHYGAWKEEGEEDSAAADGEE